MSVKLLRGVNHLVVEVFWNLCIDYCRFVPALLDEKSWILGLQLRGAVQSAQVQMAQAPSQGKHWPVSTSTVDKFDTEIGRLSRNPALVLDNLGGTAPGSQRSAICGIFHMWCFPPWNKVLRWFNRTDGCLWMPRIYVVALTFPQTLSYVPTAIFQHSSSHTQRWDARSLSQLISRSL